VAVRHAWRGTTETTTALKAYLDPSSGNSTLYMVELYDLVLTGLGHPSKLTFRWCDQPFDVPFYKPQPEGGAAAVYAGGLHVDAAGVPDPAPLLQRGTRRDVIGVEVDSLDVDLFLDGTELLPPADGGGSTPRLGLSEGIMAGVFDGAYCTMRRLYLAQPPTAPFAASIANRGDLGPGDTSLGAVTLFAGFLTEAKVGQTRAPLTIKSALEKASVGMPWRIYQANCPFDLYGPLCGVAKTASFGGYTFQATAQVSTITPSGKPGVIVVGTTSYPTDTALGHYVNYFRFGTLQFTSGALAGLMRSVQGSVSALGLYTEFTLLSPLPRVPAAGDTFVVQAGCKKTLADCTTKFGNFVDTTTEVIGGDTVHTNGSRFGGMARVPPPDSAV
jgi:hypothetical protein